MRNSVFCGNWYVKGGFAEKWSFGQIRGNRSFHLSKLIVVSAGKNNFTQIQSGLQEADRRNMQQKADKIVNYYEMLGIDPKAGPAEIKRAYHDQLKIWHPDKNADRLAEAEETTKILNQAYSILSDPERRKQYDRILRYTKGQDFGKILNEKEFWDKVGKASPVLRRILKDLKDLYALFVDSIKGRYKLHPAITGIIGGGLLYFIVPLDLIPDYIPIVGLLDDFAVLSAIINSLQDELAEYRKFRDELTS